AYLVPESTATVNAGSKFILDLNIHPGNNTVSSAQSYMTFDSSKLYNVDVDSGTCNQSDTVKPDTTVFDGEFQNEVCNGPGNCVFYPGPRVVGPGTIAYASGVLANSAYNGPDFRVAQIAF